MIWMIWDLVKFVLWTVALLMLATVFLLAVKPSTLVFLTALIGSWFG